MQVHTVVLLESEDDQPRVAGFYQYSGKNGKRQAEKKFKALATKILGLSDKLDMADESEVDSAWAFGVCQEYDVEYSGYRGVEYYQTNCRGK